MKKLTELGADPAAKDAVRILRVLGTINSKTNGKESIIEERHIAYTLYEFMDEYMPRYKKSKAATEKQRAFAKKIVEWKKREGKEINKINRNSYM